MQSLYYKVLVRKLSHDLYEALRELRLQAENNRHVNDIQILKNRCSNDVVSFWQSLILIYVFCNQDAPHECIRR